MNRIAQQQHHTGIGIAHAIARHLARYAVAGGLGALLALSMSGCAIQTADEGDTSSAAAAGNDKTVEAPPPGSLPPAVRASTPNSQPGALRGAAPAGGPGGGEDPQPSPWIGTDNNDQGSPLNRQQMGASVEHK